MDLSSEDFNSAVITVLAAIERGYYPSRDPTSLNPRDWARLACTLVSAIGRGYHRQDTEDNGATLEKIRGDLDDPNPITPLFPTLFHRLAASAESLEFCVSPDIDNYKGWYLYYRNKVEKEIARLATVDVEEKWREWKADQIDRRAAAQEAEMATAVRNRNACYFMTAAHSIGLNAVFEGPFDGPRPVSTTGQKRTASGTVPAPGPSKAPSETPDPGPSTPTATRTNPPRAAKRRSPSTTPRGRSAMPDPATPSRADPSPTPRSKKAPPKPGVAIGETGQLDAKTIMMAVQATINPFMAQLDALERASMPPPQTTKDPRNHENTTARAEIEETSRTTQAPRAWQPLIAAGPPDPATRAKVSEPVPASRASETAHRDDQEFIPVKRRNRKKKGGNGGDPTPQPPQINLTPASFASIATAATNIQQNKTSPREQSTLPSITEVTVLRRGGCGDDQVEQYIRARAADAIVREVKINMAKAVATPIPLRAGRWSVHPQSKGNFVYSFNGYIPFDIISSYEHILLGPFQGSGQLCPSLGWTRLLVHGVPVTDNDGDVFGPQALLLEVRSLPGLKKSFFSMPPRWLKPVGGLPHSYSSITFAVSDPDGSVISTLLKGRAALFGKEVKIQKWIDKPALVQCSRCHALRHTRVFRACPLSADSVKCFICGGAHKSEEHDQRCPRKHTIAGVCDCTNYKCLNCQKPGHHCRDELCPARALFRPRNTKRSERAKDKGKGRDPAEGPGLPPTSARIEQSSEQTYDLFNPPPPPPDPAGPQTRAARRRADEANSQAPTMEMEIDGECPAGQGTSSTTQRVHSPSRPQSGAAVEPCL